VIAVPHSPHSGIQFRAEGSALCDFVRRRHRHDRHLLHTVAEAEAEAEELLAEPYDDAVNG
jgi:hypothetical protein